MKLNQNMKGLFAFRGFAAATIALLVVMLVGSSALLAQNYAGSLRGTVTDPSGAAVPGATVTVVSLATNSTKTAVTTDLGAYSVPDLPVGAYEVHIKAGSFKEYVAKSVEIHTSSVTEVNAQLAVGAASDVVTVEASDIQVETSTAAVGEVVTGTQVRELPLNGENFMGLVTLSPGVSAANSFNSRDKGLAGGSDFAVNGNPYTNNLFLVDGVNNVDMGSGRTILVYPSTDSIAEFKMIRNSYGPEYGQASGAIISINTKSGENTWHGGAFYSGRNDALNANDWFSNANQTGKAELRRNDWGYNVSGPIVKNKLFFWWNEEWNREIRGQSFTACVPTAAEKQGDFSGGVSCGASVPVIPAQFQGANPLTIANPDAAGLLISKFYPDPNIPGATGNQNNWAESEPNKLNWREENVRVDFDVTKKHRITFRYTKDSWDNPAPNGGAFWGDSFFTNLTSNWSQPSHSLMAKLTSQLSDTLVNDIHFGWGYNAIITTANDPLGIASGLETAIPNVWPTQKDSGAFINGGGAWGGLNPYGSGQTLWNIAPYGNHEDLYTIQDNLTKVHGNHTFKVGAFWSTNAKVENNNGGADRPTINPTSIATGGFNTNNPLANILIPGTGPTPQLFNVSEASINPNDHRIWHDFEWYAGDTWRIRRNLTLELGFRWSFFFNTYNEFNQQASWSLSAWSASEAIANPTDACNGVIIVPGTTPCADAKAALAGLGVNLPLSDGTPGPNAALVKNNHHNIAPRIGIAWDVKGDGKTAVRVGLGQFYQRELVGIARTLAGTAPFVINATVVRPLDSAPALTSNISVSPNASKENSTNTPNSWQWNASIERELWRNTSLNVGYVGNTGIHLTLMRDANPVASSSDWLAEAFANGGTAQNALRGAFNFGSIGEFDREGHSTYHSLQVLFRTKTSANSSFQAAYTWSHNIGNTENDNSSGSVNQEAITDQSNTILDKGNTNINRPHVFVANEVYYLPKLADKSALVRQTLGGWEFNSIITVQSGTSFSVFTNGASGATVGGVQSNLNSLVGTGFNQNNRPLITGVGCNSDTSGKQIFNPAAFTIVGYAIGNIPSDTAPRGYCFGPNTRNFDMRVGKNWTFKERYNLRFTLDMFNAFNHANFSGVGINNGFAATAVTCSNPAAPCSPTNNIIASEGGGGNFGQATAVKPGRELQYGLKFTF